ncbi:MAG: FAD-dependent oxidoreductase, partial [Candidatus Tectomicrobia bacterium]|nr:FAD-dependent oxidoreductase [Candidatus Tectomicrobia bacterium]
NLGFNLVAKRKLPLESHSIQDLTALQNLAALSGPFLKEDAPSSKHVAVIGSGVAGMTCAHDLAILGNRVRVFEAQQVPGGMLVLGVPEYRLPRSLIRAEIDAILDLGVEIRFGQTLGKDFLIRDLWSQGFDAVFLAIGAHKSRELRMEGVELDGVFRALEFLLNVNLDYRVNLGRRVVVVGGGDVAMDAARSAARELLAEEVRLSTAHVGVINGSLDAASAMREAMDVAREAMRRGTREVQVVCLESWEEMPAQRFEVEEAIEEGVMLHTRLGPKRILGEDGKVRGIEMLAVRSVFDEKGRFNPAFVEGSEQVMEADSVILAVGQTSDLSFLTPEDSVELTPRGTIKVDLETMATTAPGIFAGGDVALGPRIFIEGVETGHRAARGIHEYLSGRKIRVEKREHWAGIDFREQHFFGAAETRRPWLPVVQQGYEKIPRESPPAIPVDRRIGIAEVELCYGEMEARRQASRCLRCGMNPIFDATRCILCGGCVDVCPHWCLRMVPLPEIEEGETLSRLVEAPLGSPAGSAMIMDTTACIRCSLCALRCPTGAITMESFQFVEELTYE